MLTFRLSMSAKEVIKQRLRKLQHRVQDSARRRVDAALEKSSHPAAELQVTGNERPVRDADVPEPPVVARMMIEIRSDGSRTIARGALQDEASGQKVSLEAQGETPAQLAAQLTRSLLSLPLTSMQLTRTLLRKSQKK